MDILQGNFMRLDFWHQIIILYPLGVFVAYVWLKIRNWDERKENNWGDVKLRLVISLTSWVCVVILLLNQLFNFVDWIFQRKPPSWL